MATRGTTRIVNTLPELSRAIPSKMQTAMQKAAYTVHGELTSILSGSRSGRIYRVPGTKRTYQASAPGQAPASRLGDLRTSYRPVVEGTGLQASARVGSPLRYALYLEHGTRRMAKRPHLRKAFEQSRTEWLKHFEDLI